MQASIESTGNLERRLTFSLPAERLDGHIGRRLGEISRTVRIKGFRPGKVPAKVVEQRFGPQVRAEALDGLLRETFDAAIRENALLLAGAIALTQFKPTERAAVLTLLDGATEGIARARAALTTTSNTADGSKS